MSATEVRHELLVWARKKPDATQWLAETIGLQLIELERMPDSVTLRRVTAASVRQLDVQR